MTAPGSDGIVIAGAGPVGLALALGLARAGVDVTVLEAAPALGRDPRASTWHPSTLDMLASWGVADQVIARGQRIDRLQFWERATRRCVADLPYSLIAGDTRYPFRLQCPQYEALPILRDAAVAAGARVRFDSRVVAVADRGDHVELEVDSSGTRTRERARWLCGADGAHSTVREQLGVAFPGSTYEDRFLLVTGAFDVGSTFRGMGPVGYVFDPDEWVIVMRLPDTIRIVFRVRPDEDVQQIQQRDAVARRVEALLGRGAANELEAISYYAVHQRVAETFRVGRVLLLGDAAHLNNPAGGMGMNSGIHDAHALVPELAAVIAGADDARLTAWAERRRQVAAFAVQRDADENYKNLTERDPARRAQRNHELAAIAADPDAARRFLLRSSMLRVEAA